MPFVVTLANEKDIFANTDNGVHVVSVDDGGDIKLLGDTTKQFINYKRRLWVETRVRLIAE